MPTLAYHSVQAHFLWRLPFQSMSLPRNMLIGKSTPSCVVESTPKEYSIPGHDVLSMPSLSVIIPVHNGGEAFLRCLDSLTSSAVPAEEIIVVADGETDGVWRHAYGYGARVIEQPTSRGPAFARNLGADAATGDILVFIDADVVVLPHLLGLIRETFLQDSNLAAVIGSYDDRPAVQTLVSRYRNLLHHYTHQTAHEDAITFWGACGAIRRDVFMAVGGFDERYTRPCVEDIELGYRLTQAGYRIRLRKDLQVQHLKRWTALNMIQTDLFARAIPWTELILGYHRLPNDLNLRLENRLSVAAVFALLASLLMAFWAPSMLIFSIGLLLLLVGLNARFYRFLLSRHGFLFGVGVLPWHWLFYVYSGIGFVAGSIRYGGRSLFSSIDTALAPKPTPVKVPDLNMSPQATNVWTNPPL